MGNGVSTGQENLPSHDQRDVSASAFEEQHDWSGEQAESPETHSLSTSGKPYNRITWNTMRTSMKECTVQT